MSRFLYRQAIVWIMFLLIELFSLSVQAAAAEKIIVSDSKKTVTALNGDGRVIAQYPAVMGGAHDPLPIGAWKVTVIEP